MPQKLIICQRCWKKAHPASFRAIFCAFCMDEMRDELERRAAQPLTETPKAFGRKDARIDL